MFEPAELRKLICQTLTPIDELYSPESLELLMATCAQESHLGTYRQQVGGPALGIFQMEPATWNDIWANYLVYHTALAAEVKALQQIPSLGAREMITNDPLAIAMARVHYLRVPEPLPAMTDLAGLWRYYKAHYNTPQGAATQDEFFANYKRLVGGPAM